MMKKYIGTKLVQAIPAIRKGGKVYLPTDAIPRTMDKVEEGYKVIYEDGYESWSPKEVFEKAYKLADSFKDRLIIEQKDLAEKLSKLCAFVDSPKFEETVKDVHQRDLLVMQRFHMGEYLNILNQRIQSLE
ncbi:crAss001_48 related protein [Bacteroides clarus]|jgi:hypothetical protein|uniref:crAss001_48 related protein n=1 Tax=Bacteroides clarus TaxID=626929 RepID=UPI00266B6317|nr:hypothetical protein [Bacteroides clarus]